MSEKIELTAESVFASEIEKRQNEIRAKGWCEQCQNPWQEGTCSCGNNSDQSVQELQILSLTMKNIMEKNIEIDPPKKVRELPVKNPDPLTPEEIEVCIAINKHRYPSKENYVHHESEDRFSHVITDMSELYYWTLDNPVALSVFPNDFFLLNEGTRNQRIERMIKLVERSPSTWSHVTKLRFSWGWKYGYKVNMEPLSSGVSFTVWLDAVTPEWKHRRVREKRAMPSLKCKCEKLLRKILRPWKHEEADFFFREKDETEVFFDK